MRRRDIRLLVGILVVIAFSAWVAWPANPGIHLPSPIKFDREIKLHEGLDLRGGMQVLLEADWPATQPLPAGSMDAVRTIVENRVNGLGVTEPVVQQVGDRRILVELPGIEDPVQAVASLRNTGLLEFIDAGDTPLQPGTIVKTTYGRAEGTEPATPTSPTPAAAQSPATTGTPAAAPTGTATLAATPGATSATTPEPNATLGSTPAAVGATTPAPTQPAPSPTPTEVVYRTVMTGAHLKSAAVTTQRGQPDIQFELNSEGAKIFADHTAQNVNKYLAIVLDKQVISCPVIRSAIPDGNGVIEGQFTLAEAQGLVVQLKYGALPIGLKVVDQKQIGPTLGQDSVERSIRAGVIGLVIVLLFMLIYYRLPGLLADLALISYALVTLALFKLIPVTLTLPGVTGFLLSVGMAVDANILIFERMKEELRNGKSLAAAIDAGFDRAWTSIRDSNLSTLITCAILFWFGSTYGASAVKGFAVTLFLGVLVSMFTAITVTRTFMRSILAFGRESLRNKPWLLGV